ncbi:MAG: fumarylacetoacetate hydrolase family protein [Candidatus Lokiarchaeota archaeon]|nr:fumarylacetoacetate hydrolase family protein [Candidatus Lokiarchaeota archaeon]
MTNQIITLPIMGTEKDYHVNPSKIICLGLNYAAHAAETNREPPKEPLLFPKTPNTLIGHEDPIIFPKILHQIGLERVDYEGELAVIIGKKGKNIPRKQYAEYIFGYSCFNDITARDLQLHDRSKSWPWFKSKSFDTFGAIGPNLVLHNDIGEPNDLQLLTRQNNTVVQKTNTSDMIFKVDYVLEFISKFFTLYPGDIIATGTPSGIGPLAVGDIIEIEIQKIGILRNHVQAE